MISIRKAANDLERMEDLLRAVSETYGYAIRSTAEYAIEFNPHDTRIFREHLQALESQVRAASVPADWRHLQASFRGELRDYRDRTLEQLGRLREEIRAAAEAVQIFAESISATDGDHREQIKQALERLERAAGSDNLEEMRSGILEAAKAISESVQVMERSHKVAIAELRDEIRLLHKQIERERNTPFIDPATDVWNRSKLDTNIEDLLRQQRPFCVLLVCVRNLKLLELRHSRTVLAGALKALLQRLAAMLDERAGIGRWDEQNFAAILEMDSKQAIAVSRTAAARLSGTYSVQENGLSHTVVVQAVTGVIERDSGTDSQSIRQKLAQMSEALAGG